MNKQDHVYWCPAELLVSSIRSHGTQGMFAKHTAHRLSLVFVSSPFKILLVPHLILDQWLRIQIRQRSGQRWIRSEISEGETLNTLCLINEIWI